MSFLWCTLHVRNLEESIEFYEKFVGLSVNRRIASRQGIEIVFLGNGETQLELVGNIDCYDYPISDQISIGFSVDSVENKIMELKEAGIELYSEIIQPNPHVKFVIVKDPNEISVQFVEAM